VQGILPLTPLGALPQTPHSPCGRGISYCFFPLGKCYASLRQGRVVFSPAEKISTLCLDCVLALSAVLCRFVSLSVGCCRSLSVVVALCRLLSLFVEKFFLVKLSQIRFSIVYISERVFVSHFGTATRSNYIPIVARPQGRLNAKEQGIPALLRYLPSRTCFAVFSSNSQRSCPTTFSLATSSMSALWTAILR
jgi:hypothetical protein